MGAYLRESSACAHRALTCLCYTVELGSGHEDPAERGGRPW
jgi:hypothetical protein